MLKKSLTMQYMGTILGMVAGTVLLCWFLNTTFLEYYYTYNKQKAMLEGFSTIDGESRQDTMESAGFDVEFERICSDGNISILIISADGSIVRTSVNDTQTIKRQFMDVLFGNYDSGASEIIKETNDYVLRKQADSRMGSEYLILLGTLSDGNLILMRTALESIRESAGISNRFLAYSGTLAVVLSAMLSIFASRKIAKPILELTDISKRMTDLDFNAKYQSKGENEIDQLGEHINQLSHTLEKTISELKSANNELLIDIERKTQIDEMRKDFLSNVSHELKTPLALIQGYAEGLLECINEDEESRSFYCEVIMDEADKMNQMVKKLLTLNQLEFGNDIVTMERFDLTELIRGVLASASILLKQNEITLTFNTDMPMYVWADEFKVEEVVTNYLSNAIHHVQDPKHIDIKYTQMEDYVRVSVFNTGQQIPSEDIDQIWVKFYKVDKARTREYGGSGIGLSIVKAIMDSFHRECGVRNHANGVEFWFELDTKSQ
ncbi:MAG: HAMP domain-containing protein [Eubacterium sp.]|jgi:two-component system sensor histidine kinase VanS|nr:HAMP domain-containing protein [Eubacterium sp.]